MAQKYRKIDPRVWNDEKFTRLDATEKLIALYCLTTTQGNRCGIFVLSLAMAQEQTVGEGVGEGVGGRLPLTFRERFMRVVNALGWRWDEPRRVLYFPTWWKYNPPEGANVMVGNLKDLEDLPHTPLLAEFCANTRYLSENHARTLRERYPQPSPQPSPIQEQEQEQEQDKKKPAGAGSPGSPDPPPATRKPRVTAPPTAEFPKAVAAFCDRWQAKYQAKYPFDGSKHGKMISWMLEQVAGSAESFCPIVDRFLADADPFFAAGSGHSIDKLRANFTRWLVPSSPGTPHANSNGGRPVSAGHRVEPAPGKYAPPGQQVPSTDPGRGDS